MKAREITLYAFLGAMLFALKVAFAWMPNIEPVSLLVMVFSKVMGRKALYPIYIYVALEFMTWGINSLAIPYLYMWAILAFLAWLQPKIDSPIRWAVLSGGFGLCFGLLCTPVHICVGGWSYALSWWIAGIPYDIIHCVGNFVIAFMLFVPCSRVFEILWNMNRT